MSGYVFCVSCASITDLFVMAACCYGGHVFLVVCHWKIMQQRLWLKCCISITWETIT